MLVWFPDPPASGSGNQTRAMLHVVLTNMVVVLGNTRGQLIKQGLDWDWTENQFFHNSNWLYSVIEMGYLLTTSQAWSYAS